MIYLYDRNGMPTAYFNDDIIYAFNGYPLGFLSNEYVYAFNGKQLGVYELGWVRDLWGFCVLFTENATGVGPLKPPRRLPATMPGIPQFAPIKPMPPLPYLKAARQMGWSNLTPLQFFAQ
jgi:hypothetical protein